MSPRIENENHGTQAQKQLVQTLSKSKTSQSFKEIGLFLGIFVSVFIVASAFVNANLLYHSVKNFFVPVQASTFTFTSDGILAENVTPKAIAKTLQDTETKIGVEQKVTTRSFMDASQRTEKSLQNKEYSFGFSTLPPGNRIFIPAISVEAPIVDISFASETKLKKGDFEEELFAGVVKYPSTPEPGMKGNVLLFGHTSYYWWKKNPFGEIFAKIYDLQNGDHIKLAWNGQLYTYEVIEKVVVRPSEVDKKYMEYTDGEYVTLMGCYPIGSDARRGLIIAKRIIK